MNGGLDNSVLEKHPMIPVRFTLLLAMTLATTLMAAGAEIVIEPDPAGQSIDMTRYSLGQGGFTSEPMIAPHVDALRALRPRTIRLFVQEYYDLLPALGRYNWNKLDRELEAIVATGARPFLCLCMKPPVLFPRVDETVLHPSSYEEWERFIEQLVRHVNGERKFGVEYWEIGNEVDIGERGGTPYLFKPADYVEYYTRTVKAIRRADPKAKVGGPALGHYDDPIGDALMAHAAAGKAPLDFFSFHAYTNSPADVRKRIRSVKNRLARHPQLKNVETWLNEWNMNLGIPILDPAFQPAFVLTITRLMAEEGLTGGGYYHIRDLVVDPAQFVNILSPRSITQVVRNFNELPIYLGLYDEHGRVRPTYYVFKLLAQLRGKAWRVSTIDPCLYGIAVERDKCLEVVFWSFADKEKPQPMDVALKVKEVAGKRYRLLRINPTAMFNNLELIRNGPMSDLQQPLQIRLEPYGIHWLTIDKQPLAQLE